MMINLAELGRVFIVCGKTDMRRGIDSLAYIVKKNFDLDPFSGCIFLFCGGRKDRFKALYWDGQGFWLFYKRFENGKLAWPNNEDEVRELSDEQVMRLMQGFTIDPQINIARAREFY
ncbi:IS66 family insertion sequence element accessory protein TnpB [Lactobacillus equicursoris]|uniref:IS66 family insertion sequence element accessory protein TnpB n=2 Tax=Lactobacillus equicursoris TaxID=420645 RepID=A0A844FQM5_9LACO|nr:IS66 family insertion sequence element accessory protein TnpB [Lactobacillus equicursoris]